jgi:hypothetical protein
VCSRYAHHEDILGYSISNNLRLYGSGNVGGTERKFESVVGLQGALAGLAVINDPLPFKLGSTTLTALYDSRSQALLA